jgi:hypothetical protein
MVGKPLRTLVVILLALMVPLQGMAAVVAGLCLVMGHHQDQGQNSGDGHTHAHDAHTDDHAGPSGKHDDGNNSHCGPCAGCCASASIAGPAGLPIPAAPANAKYVLFQLLPRGFQPHGLDRPPLAL